MRLSCSWACSTVRRAASVGCAVITSSSETLRGSPRAARQARRRLGEPAERLGERLARDPLLALVASPAAHAMPRLGDVGELEVEAEGAQDGGRAFLVERAHAGRERGPIGRPSRSSWPRARGGGRARRRPAAPRRPARRARARARRRPGGRRAAGRRPGGSGNARRPRRRRCSTWPKPMGMRARRTIREPWRDPRRATVDARAIDRHLAAARANLALRVAGNPARAGARRCGCTGMTHRRHFGTRPRGPV